MTGNAPGGSRVLGSLRAEDGTGVVRMEDRYATDLDDLWSALTDPQRLARWLGEVDGDLRVGGEFRARFFATGWEGSGRVQACEPPRRLLVLTRDPDEPGDHTIEVTLTAEGEETVLVVEERGMPVDQLAGYGAGVQVHIEDLSDHLAGVERRPVRNRWDALLPDYQVMAANVR